MPTDIRPIEPASREFAMLAGGHCPDCQATDFRPGPRGGLAQNIECRCCLARFSITIWHGDFIYAERVPTEAEGGALWIGEGDPIAHDGKRWIAQRPAINAAAKCDELAREIGRRVGEHGARPEDWLNDNTRADVVTNHARAVLIGWLVNKL